MLSGVQNADACGVEFEEGEVGGEEVGGGEGGGEGGEGEEMRTVRAREGTPEEERRKRR
jgi:hypothetical protein